MPYDQNSLERLAEDLDRIEADLVRIQSRCWSIRQRLQRRVGKEIGFQYDEPNARSGLVITHNHAAGEPCNALSCPVARHTSHPHATPIREAYDDYVKNFPKQDPRD